MKKLLVTTIAASVLFNATAFAGASSPDYPGAVEHGTSSGWGTGIPYIMPFVSDRTPKRTRSIGINESPIIGKGRISITPTE